jgi:long-chain acyl-CoA synthetase
MSDPYASKPWLKHYDEHVPQNLHYPEKTYIQLYHDATAHIPGRVTLYYMGRGITCHELDAFSNSFALFLKANGLKPGETVGVNLPNIPAFYISILGILKAGCVLTGVSPLLQSNELQYQLKDCGAKLLVTLDAYFEKVAAVVAHTAIKTLAVASIADFLSPLKKGVGRLLKKIPGGKTRPIDGINVVRFSDVLLQMSADRIEEPLELDIPCLMQYTGGTTGPPKGAVLTHKNVVSQLLQVSTWLDLTSREESTLFSAFPLFHQAGLFLALTAFANGAAQVAVPNPRDLDFLISAMKSHKPNGVVNVPTTYLELLKKPKFRALDFTGVEWFISGAAPFPPEYIREFEDVVGKDKLIEVLGMTETSPVHMGLPRYGKKKPGSVGIPFPDTAVKLVDPETGEIVPPGEPGELMVKGPQVFTVGYHNKPEETANTLKDGWIYTGDVCKMDGDGYFYVVDRVKDMVIVSGYKVFTRTVDDVLMEHEDVDVAATIGLPDPDRPGSEIVATAVVLRPGVEKSDAIKELLARYLREKLAPYKVPKRIEFMDELPVSAVGKILKRDLREIMQ